ncbi:MAG: SAM-dependent methyltransferase [Spirochaetaceae bacterium]
MDIENQIDSKTRLKQGIFFTKLHVVNKITSHFKLNNVKHVIDSAAGSCNFLIDLAKKNQEIEFYGIEKNETIYNNVLEDIKGIKNLHYFKGDILLDKFPIPKCDLYIGNPPFINFSDLDEDYREKIKPIWLSYFPESKGFKMLLGDSRGDISQLIFAFTVKQYLKNSGRIGVILPNSLIKGNSASAGFRKFQNIVVESIVDISDDNPFNNTTRNCFYILAKNGGKTKFPIKYIVNNRIIKLVKAGDDLVEQGQTILQTSEYKARQGVNTLGANSVFFFKEKPAFESKLLKPLLKSSDINPFNYEPSYQILYPYKNGKLIPEETLMANYPIAYNYLSGFREKLEHRKSRFAQKCWYSLFGVGPYTCAKYKVVWRGLGAKELVAALTTDTIPNQSMNCYIPTETELEGHFLCGIMNSKIFKSQLNLLNEEGAKSFAQPNTINKIYIPLFNQNEDLHSLISDIANQLTRGFNTDLYKELNNRVLELYQSLGFLTLAK